MGAGGVGVDGGPLGRPEGKFMVGEPSGQGWATGPHCLGFGIRSPISPRPWIHGFCSLSLGPRP